ncbi:hypothetical protein E3E30_02180 [Thermococcus sp. 9N3]|nr:hypothetical protein [Thermococcus sp. 9N3]
MDRIKLLAGLSAVLILIATGATWVITRDINTTIVILTLASTLATVMMAVTIYELDIALKELNFEAVSAVYEMMDEKVKGDITKIRKWHQEDSEKGLISKGDEVKEEFYREFFRDNEKVKTVSDASRVLNRIGYFVYRDFVGDWFIQEQYAGLILDSFLAMKPYLKALRNRRECGDEDEKSEKEGCKNGPWFLRRFYLLLVVISYDYLCREFQENCEKTFKKYGYPGHTNPIPKEWLAEDVRKWLKKKGYKNYV